jgi:NAD+ synthase (glutamine-hydrolysing)
MAFFHHGLLRVAVASPRVTVGDPRASGQAIAHMLEACRKAKVGVVVFPELSLTGYSCGDLFGQRVLLDAALDELQRILEHRYRGLAVVGLPLAVGNDLYNTAAVLCQGRILGLVPKAYLPTYKEFYERRWFAPGRQAQAAGVTLLGQEVPFGCGLLFRAEDIPGCLLGVEVCEDLWVPVPPSAHLALQGATILVNPSASTELVGKAPYRRMLVASQSGRCIAAYLYAGSAVTESTTDVIFGGQSLVAENGVIIAETERFERDGAMAITEIDLQRLTLDRLRQGTFGDAAASQAVEPARIVSFRLDPEPWQPGQRLQRRFDPHPFVPSQSAERDDRCSEIFNIQVAGLAKRLETVGDVPLSIGISGGMDSTLSLLVACQTLDLLNRKRERLQALVMPGFGSTGRVKKQAQDLIHLLGVRYAEADIRQLCLEEMRLLGHRPFGIDLAGLTVEQLTQRLQAVPAAQRSDLVFENVQARMRTNLLMNAGFVIGTGDLSELALGWCTYNGDHISMYNPNMGVPKTLVRFMIRWVAAHRFAGGPLERVLSQIASGVITPELLPCGPQGEDVQDTETSVGPFELQDFYLYYFLRFGFAPAKLLFLAEHVSFEREYSTEDRRKWLRLFLQRIFANQFKRSCLPDGPKVGTVSLSPRGDWRMPSDASPEAWLADLESGQG